MKKTVVLTMGDPVGVGPEIVVRALASTALRRRARPVVVGDVGVLERVASLLGRRLPRGVEIVSASRLDAAALSPGRPTGESGAAMIGYIDEAVAMVKDGRADALVTAPISKEAAKKAGFAFPGHTEYLAHLTGAKEYCMMLGGPRLRVVLATIHAPLRRVPELITRAGLVRTLRLIDRSFRRYFAVERPRIAVAGLNPHAGESGLFGDEEARIIAPAIRNARRQGIDAEGPLPGDTVFFRAAASEFDCVLAMYHDQGLAPLKLIHFEDGYNCTLGLPIIRTSVDHGTAYDIAWRGKASAASLAAATRLAVSMAEAAGGNFP
ncbi:MAG TPA: 4-hydroxythreonine-4-phosphate dehydrogenase PdxA [Deltaproteobacteria bacterium]|nr:4-hydroxythreonine-4-phosphate dehydrogenase PdxA [Deltaproteobacteria bacterium]